MPLLLNYQNRILKNSKFMGIVSGANEVYKALKMTKNVAHR